MRPRNCETMGAVFCCDDLSVVQWHPERDGKGKPEQVHIVASPDGLSTIIMRLKSRNVAEQLAAAILEHAREVWPDA